MTSIYGNTSNTSPRHSTIDSNDSMDHKYTSKVAEEKIEIVSYCHDVMLIFIRNLIIMMHLS